MRQLSYTNGGGQTVALDWNPYLITSLEGIDQAPVSVQSQKAPSQDGETYIDALLDVRDISVTASIIARDMPTIWQKRQALIQAFNPKLGEGWLTLTNDRGNWKIRCNPVGPVFKNKHYKDPYQEFTIDFECRDPYWYATAQSSVNSVFSTGNMVWPNLTFPRAKAIRNAGNITAISYGDVPAPITFTITGPSTNPKVFNVTTGEYLRVVKTLGVGDTITIQTGFGKKSIILTPFGGSPALVMNYMDLGSTFFLMQPGTNTLAFTDDVGNTQQTCVITWFDRFLGV